MGVQVQVIKKHLLSGGPHTLSAGPGKGAGGSRVLAGGIGTGARQERGGRAVKMTIRAPCS